MSGALKSSSKEFVRAAVLICLLTASWPAVIPSVAAANSAVLEERIGRILSEPPYRRAQVGVHVVELGSGRVIYGRNEERKFIVASNEKLVTAAAALEVLGESYEFRTTVLAQGDIVGGVLHGDLILRGGGDPTLGGRYEEEDALTIFRRWAAVLKARGLQQVTGDVVADDAFFDRISRHPNWSENEASKWYCPTTSALSVNDNCVVITVKPGASAGSPAVLSTTPEGAPVELVNLCKTSPKRQGIWFEHKGEGNVIAVAGLVSQGSAGYSQQVTLPNPPLYAAGLLKEALETEGIEVDGRARLAGAGRVQPAAAVLLSAGGASAAVQPLCVRRTSLIPVLGVMLKESHNYYAEQLIKTIGAETSGTGSWAAGLARAGAVLREMGFRDTDFNLDDGSGLSRQNRLTPALLTGLLSRIWSSEHGPTMLSLLAAAGEEGTLVRRLTAPPYRGNVRAKTGYINGVSALSGYATTRAGTEIAFSILINDPSPAYSMREVRDAICRAIVDCAE